MTFLVETPKTKKLAEIFFAAMQNLFPFFKMGLFKYHSRED
jgi:hypothetical protein